MSRFFIVLVFVSIVACAPKSSKETAKTIHSSIINGTNVKENDVLAKHVVAVYNEKNKSICSGALIGSNLVLTAAHCLSDKASHLKIIFNEDADYIIYAREPDVREEFMLSGIQFKAGPKWNPANEPEFDTGDIAIVKFKGNIPTRYSPVKLLTDASLLKVGTTVTLAGFGVNIVKTASVDPNTFPKLDEAISYGEVVCEEDDSGKKSKCLSVDTEGDGILRTTEAPISEFKETEVVLDETKSGTCSGDSGGPAFIKKNGELLLFGVTSRGGALCNDIGVYTNVLTYQSWISETINSLR